MLLKDYLPNINKKFKNLNFSGLAFNSKEVKKNYIFIAIKGDRFDGNNYINDAIKNGAKIIISSKFKDQIKNNIIYLKQKIQDKYYLICLHKFLKKNHKI